MRRLVLYSDQILPETEKVDQELVALLANPTLQLATSHPVQTRSGCITRNDESTTPDWA